MEVEALSPNLKCKGDDDAEETVRENIELKLLFSVGCHVTLRKTSLKFPNRLIKPGCGLFILYGKMVY